MLDYKPIKFKKDRRKGPDLLIIILSVSNIIAWSLFFALLVIIQKARPEMKTMFERGFHIAVRENWDRTLMEKAFILMVFLFVFSVISIILNKMRLRRKSDRIRLSFILSAVVSLLGIILYLIFNI